MNATTYLFGKLGQEYFQYPNDYAKSIFQDFYSRSKAKTQILVHRQDSLMYYGYVRKLDIDESQYIGMCIVLNGVMFEDIKYLFQTFEKAFIYLVLASEFLTINDRGDIIQTNQKYLQLDEINAVRDILGKRVASFNNKLVNLPPIDYSKASSEAKSFTFNDSNQSIINSTYRYSYTYIYKDKEYDTPSLFNYRGVISQLNAEKKELSKQYNELSLEHKKEVRKKKQYTAIVFFCFLTIVLSLITFYNISNKSNQIEMLNSNVLTLKKEVKEGRNLLSTQNKKMQSLTDSLHAKIKIEKQYANLKHLISLPAPILISDIEIGNADQYGNVETFFGSPIFTSATMFLTPRIKYIGVYSGNITLYIKIYEPDGILSKGTSSPIGYTTSCNMDVKLGGMNFERLIGWGNSQKGCWKSGKYSIEIWYNNICLQKKDFKIL